MRVYSLWESDNHMEGILAVLSSFLELVSLLRIRWCEHDDNGELGDG